MKARILTLGTVLAATFAASAPAATIVDRAGDANGLGHVGASINTEPASDATRDLTRVTIDRLERGIVVRFRMSAPLDWDGPMSSAVLYGANGPCEISLAVVWGDFDQVEETQGPIAVSDINNCPEEFLGIGGEGYTVTVDGSSVIAEFPYEALAANRTGVTARSHLKGLRAETRIGTFAGVSGFSSCTPGPCLVEEKLNYSRSGFVGPVIDVTESTVDSSPHRRYCIPYERRGRPGHLGRAARGRPPLSCG